MDFHAYRQRHVVHCVDPAATKADVIEKVDSCGDPLAPMIFSAYTDRHLNEVLIVTYV